MKQLFQALGLLLEARERDVAVGERASDSCCAWKYAVRRVVSSKCALQHSVERFCTM